jgi:hypothetical protein
MQVEWVLGAAILSCTRAQCALLDALREEIADAIGRIEALQSEADRAGGESAFLIAMDTFRRSPHDVSTMDLRYNLHGLAARARRDVDAIDRIRHWPMHYAPQDFIDWTV